MNKLMSAFEGISDKHIKEFAFVQIPPRTIPVWIKVCSMAASFVLIALTIILVVSRRSQLSPVTGSESESEYNSSGFSYPQTDNSENKTASNSNVNSDHPISVIPLVVFNDVIYVIANDSPTYDLPDGYVMVGEVTSNDNSDRDANGYSSGCKVGDKIYQNPANPHDVFVNTELFSGGAGYWYVRFVGKG